MDKNVATNENFFIFWESTNENLKRIKMIKMKLKKKWKWEFTKLEICNLYFAFFIYIFKLLVFPRQKPTPSVCSWFDI